MSEPQDHATVVPGGSDQRPGIADYLLAMSHEIRAPLNAVIGMSGLLLEGELIEKNKQYAKSIHAAGESLAAVLNDLIDLSRVGANRLTIEPIAFDLKSMVEETANVLSPRANDRGLVLRVDWRPELPRHVVGDPGRSRQVLGNLVGHAVNGTSQGEVVIRVVPDGERNGVPLVRFVVEDTGIGIMPERLAHVFDHYVPVDASPYRSFGVTGLGLRLSADLVRRMGGEIGATSEPGKGSRFWFVLPMPSADPIENLNVDRPRVGGRVLIVESDPAAQNRYQGHVEASGWAATFVDNPTGLAETLRAAQLAGEPFQACIISDYAVRPLHLELANHLKAEPDLARVVLVMVTAVGSPGEGKKLWHAGFGAYLRKPVPVDEIRDTLAALPHLGPEGRGASLITRHSLAEVRNAQTFASDGIDEMLASLTPAEDEPAQPQAGPTFVPIFGAMPPTQLAPVPAPAPILEPIEEAVPPSATVEPEALAIQPEASAIEPETLTIEPETPTIEPETLAVEAVTEPILFPAAEPEAEAEALVAAPEFSPETMTVEPPTFDVEMAPPPTAQALELVVGEPPAFAEPNTPLEVELPVVEAVVETPPASAPSPELFAQLDTVELLRTTLAVETATQFDGLVVERDEEWAAPVSAVEHVEGLDKPMTSIEATGATVEALDDVVPAGAPLGDSPIEHLALVAEVPAPSEPSEPAEEPVTEVVMALSIPLLPPAAITEEAIDTPLETEPDPVVTETVAEVNSLVVIVPAQPTEDAPAEVSARSAVLEEVPTLDVVAPEFIDSVARGGGFFVQHIVSSFVREVPRAIAGLAMGVNRGDRASIDDTIAVIQRAAVSVGAARLTDLVDRVKDAVAGDRIDEAAGSIGAVEHSFLEVRHALDVAAPTGLPAELPAVGPMFLDQLAPSREGPGRVLALKLTDTFLADGAERIGEIRAAVAGGQADAAQRIAQTFKGMCGLVGADALGKLSALVEADARLKRVTQAERYLDYLDREFERVRQALAAARG